MPEKIAVFPGSFDPITLGHYDIITRALILFDRLIIAIGRNSEKDYMFPLKERQKWVESSFSEHPKIKIISYQGLTVRFCQKIGARFILRGLRNPADFEFEKAIVHTNRTLTNDEIETVFLLTSSENSFISSSIVRDVIRNGGEYNRLVPSSVNLKD
ncbi:pantetheine-phosphate adenylyltransferase [Bacteroidetes bacterium endosymbiont of Geopemphigus sp.]|uniref:pantetheine-phosphate adenylyltransferase n=1 Tax=Bacteroidetes bacterium endosymbiont of Geopemphigus sp. TaxID=2047937 RepID=UPI000CD29E15|nr:pantetheine-phosphate adenylyltransferase [Bacteroidetes bacterium endosymbiont of Geopemphigus sp.]